jgi:trans-aconitate 2-methyltransferase
MVWDRMGAKDWNPAQYERFRAERRQPFVDLLALVQPRPGMRVTDLGCGTGELTRDLHHQLQARDTLGIDRSPAMLARSAEFATDGLRFEIGDIAAFTADRTYDLVFSNAALHWIPEPESVLARLTAALADGGQLAVQVPANHDHPSHTIAAEVADEEPFRTALGGHVHRAFVLPPERYAVLLHDLGFTAQHVRLQVYVHLLASRADVVEWVKGTLLTDVAGRLPADLYERFLARYRERLMPALADTRPHVYPFKRILLWGRRPG